MRKTIIALFGITALWVHAAAGAGGEWLTSLEKAQSQAKKENKMVLMDFTGSDWCPPCKALHKNVLSSKEFMEFAKKNLVLVEVDFPEKKALKPDLKKANDALAKRFEIEAFPTIVVLDSNGKQLFKENGYTGEGPKAFIAKIQKAAKK